MKDDPIIDEIRKIRDQFANEVRYNVRALGRKMQKKQRASKHEVVSLMKKKIEEEPYSKKTKVKSKSHE